MNLQTTQDPNHLRHAALVLQAQNRHLLGVVAQLQKRLAALEETAEQGALKEVIAQLNALAVDGKKAATTPDKSKSDKPRKPQTGHGPTQQPLLERETLVCEHDEADRMCPSCGGQLKPLGDQFESSEMIDVVEVSYRLVEVQRQKYSCRCGGCVETAPGPERAIEGGRYSLEFAAKVATDKYLDHMPLTRQVKTMARRGLVVKSQTLWDQLRAVAAVLMPVYLAIKEHIVAQSVIGLDQTGWPNLQRKGAKKWQMWALTSVGAVFHTIRDDKGTETFVDLVGDFDGTIVCDALATHGAGAREGPGNIVLAGCWAHHRRRYKDAEADFPQARTMLDMIHELYAIDAKAKTEAERGALRKTESKKVVERIQAWLTTTPALTSTSLGAAIRHTANDMQRLKRFLDDPKVWIDNNATERALRGPAVGRRVHFGSKSKKGTEIAGVFYTLMETAKLRGIDPAAYIVAATKHARMDETLMPWDFDDNQ